MVLVEATVRRVVVVADRAHFVLQPDEIPMRVEPLDAVPWLPWLPEPPWLLETAGKVVVRCWIRSVPE